MGPACDACVTLELLQSHTLRRPFAAPSQQDLGGRQRLFLIITDAIESPPVKCLGAFFPGVVEWSVFLFPLFALEFLRNKLFICIHN